MPAPSSQVDADPPVLGELWVSQGKAGYAIIRFEPGAIHATLIANGFNDWARVVRDLAKLGLSDVTAIDIDVPRARCRFRDGGSADPVLEVTDAPAHGGALVLLFEENLV